MMIAAVFIIVVIVAADHSPLKQHTIIKALLTLFIWTLFTCVALAGSSTHS